MYVIMILWRVAAVKVEIKKILIQNIELRFLKKDEQGNFSPNGTKEKFNLKNEG